MSGLQHIHMERPLLLISMNEINKAQAEDFKESREFISKRAS